MKFVHLVAFQTSCANEFFAAHLVNLAALQQSQFQFAAHFVEIKLTFDEAPCRWRFNLKLGNRIEARLHKALRQALKRQRNHFFSLFHKQFDS